jgi:hypothetical protein
MHSWKELHLAEEALGGLSAGVLGTVIGFPLDLVKTRMQTAKTTGNNGVPMSILSVGQSIVRTEGVLALYKGLLPPLISLSILNTITFAQYSLFRDVYSASAGWDARNALAGISCSPIGSMVSTIENLVKVGHGVGPNGWTRIRNHNTTLSQCDLLVCLFWLFFGAI